MPAPRRFALDELVNRPGTYFNPQTAVLVVVDDSPALDTEIFSLEEELDDADWVLIADEVPIEEHQRDELMERFQIQQHAGLDEEEDDEAPEVLEADEEPELGE